MPRTRIGAFVGALVACVVLVPGVATATSDNFATAHPHGLVQQRAERGLLLGNNNVSMGADGSLFAGETNIWGLRLPFRYGAKEHLDVFADLYLQTVDPTASLPAVGARYRFIDGLLELAGEVKANQALSHGVELPSLHFGVPMRIHFRENLSLDATPTLSVFISPVSEVYPTMRLSAYFNLTDAIAITGHTGFTMQSRKAGPSGLQIGASWTMTRKGLAFLEVGGHFAWTTLVDEGATGAVLFLRVYQVHPVHHEPPIVGTISD